jgi:hypothetical protein
MSRDASSIVVRAALSARRLVTSGSGLSGAAAICWRQAIAANRTMAQAAAMERRRAIDMRWSASPRSSRSTRAPRCPVPSMPAAAQAIRDRRRLTARAISTRISAYRRGSPMARTIAVTAEHASGWNQKIARFTCASSSTRPSRRAT